MIKLKFESAGCPDYSRITCAYMDREYTVFDFIDEILKKYPKDYGRINIGDNIFYEYKDGVLDWALIPQELFYRVVENVEGMSSYYHTDYKLILKSGITKEKQNTIVEDFTGILNEMQQELLDLRLKYEQKIGGRILSIKTDISGNIKLSTDERRGIFGLDIEV